jgi:hypothetical protein
MKPGMSWPAFVIAMAFVAGIVPARAQDYPSRQITVIVPFPAGGASDVVARIVTNQMSKTLGQSIIICGKMDCFAEPVIGAHSRDPLARNDGPTTELSLAV